VLLGGGCSYPPLGSSLGPNQCCYLNCDSCSTVTCPVATNDCHLAGSCQTNGQCSNESIRSNGSPCNSQPMGICNNGVCESSNPQVFSTMAPTSQTSIITPTPSTRYPSATSSFRPSNLPNLTPAALTITIGPSSSCGAFCGPHGRCSSSGSSCICDSGWTGPTCDQFPCAGQTCSGHGTCLAVGDTDWRCSCQDGYSGRSCSGNCDSFGCATNTFAYSCAWWQFSPPTMGICIKGGVFKTIFYC